MVGCPTSSWCWRNTRPWRRPWPSSGRALATTNPVESELSVTRRVTSRVARWRDGDMRRQCAGLLRNEVKFCRLEGHPDIPSLLEALETLIRGRLAGIERNEA
jgi:hypothetical protein